MLIEIFQRTKQSRTGINPLPGITLTANVTEENEESHICNYVTLSLYNFIFICKKKKLEKKRRNNI